MDPSALRESVQQILDVARLKELTLDMTNGFRERWPSKTFYFNESNAKEFRSLLSKNDQTEFYAIPEEYEYDGSEYLPAGIYAANWRLYTSDEIKKICPSNADIDRLCTHDFTTPGSLIFKKDDSDSWVSHCTMEDLEERGHNLHVIHPLYLKMSLYLGGQIDSPDELLEHDMLERLVDD